MIITLSGASGTGKTTIMKMLLERLPAARPLTGTTTRDPRKTDLPNEFRYLRPEEFESYERNGDFLWTAQVGSTRHGTFRRSLQDAFAASEARWISILVPERVPVLRAYATETGCADQIRSFYILNPSEDVLRRRMAERGDTPEQIEERIQACRAFQERATSSDVPYTYIPDQDDLNAKVEQVLAGCLN